MAQRPETKFAETGIDAVAVKPAEHDLDRVADLPVGTLAVDFEGREHVPGPDRLRALAASHDVRLTVPVRADGFDPLGNDRVVARLPQAVGRVLVAGNPAYLRGHEQRRAIAPRLRAAAEAAADPWIGTESVERLALAIGGTQFELLSAATRQDVGALRAAGVDAPVAVYAPTVLTDDEDAILDAVGPYAARRRAVTERLPEGVPTDSSITGDARETLLSACRDYALAGDPSVVARRVGELRDAGVDEVVSYPARGLDAILT